MKTCCGKPPEVFHDHKIGHLEVMVIISCGICGRYEDGHTLAEAEKKWNAYKHPHNQKAHLS